MDPRHDVQVKETRRNLQPTYHFIINCLLYSRIETGPGLEPGLLRRGRERLPRAPAALVHQPRLRRAVEEVPVELRRGRVPAPGRLVGRAHQVRDPQDQRRLPAGLDRHLRQPRPRRNERTRARRARRPTSGGARPTTTSPTPTGSRSTAGTGRGRGAREAVGRLRPLPQDPLAHARRVSRPGAALREGEVFHLERTANEAARQELLRTKQDQLLELYSAWKAKPDAGTAESLERLVGEIRQLNPVFHFELPGR